MSFSDYDRAGRPLTAVYPNGEVVTTSYDFWGANTLRAGANDLVEEIRYNTRGQMTLLDRANGTNTSYSYLDVAGNFRLDTIQHGAAGDGLPDFSYAYDRIGNVTALTTNAGAAEVQEFTYDFLSRLTGASGAYSRSYTYDELGNITGLDGNSYTYTPDPGRPYPHTQPHAVTGVGSYTFTYDANGNMISREDGTGDFVQTFDAENRLVRVHGTPSFADTFDARDTGSWVYNSYQTVPYNLGGENVVKNTGTGVDYTANFYRSAYAVSSGESAQFEFQVTGTGTMAHFALEVTDAGGYNRWNILASNNKISVQYAVGGNYYYPKTLIDPVETNTWYVGTLVADDDHGFLMEVYKKDEPGVRGSYRYDGMPAGETWRFHHWIYRDLAYIDNYAEQPVTRFSYDADGQRVKTVRPDGTTIYTPFPNYEEAILLDSYAWEMEEGSGNEVLDASSHHLDGALQGPQWVSGHTGQALDFDGVNDYIQFDEEVPFVGELTVSAWVYPEQAPTGVGRLVASTYEWNGGGANSRGWFLGDSIGSDDHFYFNVFDASGNSAYAQYNGLFAEFLNEWVHVVGVFRPGEAVELYINGDLAASDTTSVPARIGLSGAYRIGARADTSSQGMWDGKIDEVKVFAYAMSEGEIEGMANIAPEIRRATYSASGQQVAVRVSGDIEVLADDFNDGDAAGWTAHNGTWNVVTSGNGYAYEQSDTVSTASNSSRPVEQAGLMGFDWTVTFDSGGRAAGMHLFASQDSSTNHGDSYLVWQDGGYVRIYESINNALAQRAYVWLPTTNGETHHYRATYDPGSGLISVWRDGQFAVSWSDSSPLTTGSYLAFRTNSSRVRFDDVHVSSDVGLVYLHSDHLGSVSAMSDEAGALLPGSVAQYYPFGAFRGTPPATNPDVSDLGYTGHRSNNTGANDLGLIYMNARYYVGSIGRFASPDTIVPDPANPQSYNRYTYVYNNPVKYWDPTGHFTCQVGGAGDDAGVTVADCEAWVNDALAVLGLTETGSQIVAGFWAADEAAGEGGLTILVGGTISGRSIIDSFSGDAFKVDAMLILETLLLRPEAVQAGNSFDPNNWRNVANFAHEAIHAAQGFWNAWSVHGEAEAYLLEFQLVVGMDELIESYNNALDWDEERIDPVAQRSPALAVSGYGEAWPYPGNLESFSQFLHGIYPPPTYTWPSLLMKPPPFGPIPPVWQNPLLR
jgi:RHS repeat-associated protein